MQRLICVLVLAICLGMTASGSPSQNGQGQTQDRFTGAWRLSWLEEPDSDGKVRMADCTGIKGEER